MDADSGNIKFTSRIGRLAANALGHTEVVAYVVLGAVLAVAALFGIGDVVKTLMSASVQLENEKLLVLTIDRLLFVLMMVEILHTVRVSFSSGGLKCEPFLVVGLIASVRRMLVITLESSQVYQQGNWGTDSQAMLNASMIELVVLGFLILVLVASIVLLRRSKQ